MEARFPGGKTAWEDYVKQNLSENIPKTKGAPAGTYTVIVRFIVSRNGDISDVIGTTHVGYGMGKEAGRIIKNGPKWIAGEQYPYGPANCYHLQPVTFNVSK